MALFLWPCMKYAFYDAAGDGDGWMEVQCIPLIGSSDMMHFLLHGLFSGVLATGLRPYVVIMLRYNDILLH